MENILQHIEQIFTKHKLLGNYDFTEEEYSLMVDYVGKLYNNIDNPKNKLIFATLVEIAKRWRQTDTVENDDENSGYWDFVFKTLFNSDIDQQLCQQYRDVISYLGKNQNLPVVKSGQKFYATLMMHAFAPQSSIYSLFDLCYNVFKKDLDFGFTSADEWLCEAVAMEMKNVLGGGYREDKKVSIGSSAYSIKIGLRSFALNEDLYNDFVKFITDTFYQINKLFNREIIVENTRLERYIVEWWKNKTESEKFAGEAIYKKRVPTVSKQGITAKYIKNNNEVFLCIPSIRLEDGSKKMRLSIYINNKQVHSEEMRTKRGELVVATKPIEFQLNDLLKFEKTNSINIRVEIKENETIIFDSEKSKTTSLNREFIIFDDEKEIFSQINRPTNYFVYSKNIDALKSIPRELTTCGTNIYNIYPNAGESLAGETKQVFFVDKTKTASLGTNACLIGNIVNVEWILDDISCIVYKNAVKLMIPENFNLKALELSIDNKHYKLHELNYEQIELNCYQFGLKALGLIFECYPTKISLYSYEKEKTLLTETIIVLPNLEIQFNNPFYYGDTERKVTINSNDETIELSWNNQDNEVICPLNDGILVIKVPYLKWRINNEEWHNEPINKKIWYKNFLQNGDLLEIDNPKEKETISVWSKANEKPFEITKNQSGKFEIGRVIYANEGKKNIYVYFTNNRNEKFELFISATKEHFIDNPVICNNGKVYWNVENTFLGNLENDFLLDIDGKNVFRKQIEGKNKEILDSIKEDIYKVTVKIKDKNIFSKNEKWDAIFEGNLIVGKSEKFRFKNKYLKIDSVSSAFIDEINNWITPRKKYVIYNLKFVEEIDEGKTYEYYKGYLGSINDNTITEIKFMKDENDEQERINPVRIELRSNNTFWLKAGYDSENDFYNENLMLDVFHKLCFINTKENKVVNLYKFKEEEYV